MNGQSGNGSVRFKCKMMENSQKTSQIVPEQKKNVGFWRPSVPSFLRVKGPCSGAMLALAFSEIKKEVMYIIIWWLTPWLHSCLSLQLVFPSGIGDEYQSGNVGEVGVAVVTATRI